MQPQSAAPWGEDSIWGHDLGADTRSFLDYTSENQRLIRGTPHPGVPELERLQAFRRNLARIGAARRKKSPPNKIDPQPTGGPNDDFDFSVVHFVTETCFEGETAPPLDVDVDLDRLLEELPPDEVPYWKAAVLGSARDASARELARQLPNRPWVGKKIVEEDGWAPSHTTLSRHWDYSNDMEKAIDELGIRARYAALWVGAEFPDKLREQGWGLDLIQATEPTHNEVMVAIQHLAEEAIAVMKPHLAFDRDADAPAYKLSPAAFLSYFAHLALEDTYAETGSRTLKWLDYPAPVPSPNTLFKYIRDLSVEDVDRMFTHATAALLLQEIEQTTEDPGNKAMTPPIHLAYDMTDFRWYGTDQEWTNGTYPQDNSTQAWQFGVLSVVGRDLSYVLGALPIKSKNDITSYLNRFLRRTESTYNLDIDWVYMDAQLFSRSAVAALRDIDAEWLIQASKLNQGEVADLLDGAKPGKVEAVENIRFSKFPPNRRPNAFAWPIPPEEVGSESQDPHKAFLTDADIMNRNLEGLGRQYRKRWGVETSIRQIKQQYHAPCRHRKQSVRAYYFMMAAILNNVAQYVDNRLEERLRAEDITWTSTEFLHAVRQIDPADIPDWGDTFEPDPDSWTTLR